MDKRTTGIVATVVAVLLCGCPGLFSLCFGAMFALISFMPGANIDIFGSSDPQQALYYGIGALCLGVLFVVVPIVVGVLTLRKPKTAAVTTNPGEPLPPAI